MAKTKENPDLKKKRLEVLCAAIDVAIENCGSKSRMLAALNITESYLYALRGGRDDKRPNLRLGMKLQVLTRAQFKLADFCESEIQDINAVAEYLVN